MSKESNQPEETGIEQIDDKSLETVRDILFGAQSREQDKRSQHLENLIKTSIDKMERDFDRKMANVEKTIDKLKDQIQKDNAATAEKVTNRFNETAASIKSLDAKTQSDLSDLQDQTNADLANLEKSAKNWNEDLAKQLELVHQQLLHAKADRSSLSELFASMAVAIADDSNKG